MSSSKALGVVGTGSLHFTPLEETDRRKDDIDTQKLIKFAVSRFLIFLF